MFCQRLVANAEKALYHRVHNYASLQTAKSQQTVQSLVQKTNKLLIVIIETANKIINKKGKSVMLDFLQIVVIYAN